MALGWIQAECEDQGSELVEFRVQGVELRIQDIKSGVAHLGFRV